MKLLWKLLNFYHIAICFCFIKALCRPKHNNLYLYLLLRKCINPEECHQCPESRSLHQNTISKSFKNQPWKFGNQNISLQSIKLFVIEINILHHRKIVFNPTNKKIFRNIYVIISVKMTIFSPVLPVIWLNDSVMQLEYWLIDY